ncbi:choline dehydrogenase-like flavoprotein [Bradyrhizobium sp. JR3.5]
MPRRLEGDFDYIIVGAGTAGCIMANRLSADPKKRVLLLEAGGKDNWIWFHIPVGYLFAIGNPRSDWMFKTEAEPGLNGRALAYPRGKVIGGSSAINAMISMRGQAADYDHWRQLGLTGWSYSDVLPAFKRLEDHFLGESEHHGTGGGWRIEAPRLSWQILDAVGDAAEEMGIKRIPDFNTGDNEGTSYFHVNQKRGRRWSSARGFLKPVLNRSNLRLETDVLVDRLIIESGRAAGVLFRQGNETVEARAKGEVILCAGSIGTTQVLHRSGIGPSEWLSPLGIDIVADVQGIGHNLQDHLQQRAIYKVSGVRTLNETYYNLVRRGLMGLDYAFPPPRAADHGAVAARHLRALGCDALARQHSVPCAAAVARQVRRSAASLPRNHGERLQSAADLARHGADPLDRARRQAVDRAELPVDRGRPPGRGRRDPHHAQTDEAEGAGEISSRGIPARPLGRR